MKSHRRNKSPKQPTRPTRAMVATCHRGLEEMLSKELENLGASDVSVRRGAVAFNGEKRLLYDALLWCRTAIRILLPVTSGKVGSREQLYSLASGPKWEELVTPGQTIAVQATGRVQGLDNTAFAAQVVKDAVVDRIRKVSGGSRPSVDRSNPDVSIHIHLSDDRSSLSLDATGEPLSHRGYRPRGGPAPLAENLAAGVLLLAGYDGSQPLVDPMCGTGTLAIEAALIATRTAPGLTRGFACEQWQLHDLEMLCDCRRRAHAAVRPAPAPIRARDCNARSVRASQRNIEAADMVASIIVEQGELEDLDLLEPGSLLVTNPPWGRRIGGSDRLQELYGALGDTLKQRASGSTAWVLVGDLQLAKKIGLRTSQRIPLFNGPVECRLLRFDLYDGSRKTRPGESSADAGE